MIAGAQSLGGVQSQTGLPLGPAPSFRQGFGRVQLTQALPLQVGSHNQNPGILAA